MKSLVVFILTLTFLALVLEPEKAGKWAGELVNGYHAVVRP